MYKFKTPCYRTRFITTMSKKIKDEFDLLFVYDENRFRRLPFSYHLLLKPVGIFPFKGDDRYITLDEIENKRHTDKDVDKSRLPDVKFCRRVNKIKHRLNFFLRILNKPELKGAYLADNSYMPDKEWIIYFGNSKNKILSVNCDGGKAKLRYVQKPAEENRGLF